MGHRVILMKRFRILLLLLIFFNGSRGFAVTKENQKTIKTYMSFQTPIDPAHVETLVDLDISFALGTTLTDWTPSRELKSGLAESWSFIGDKEVEFALSPKAKWSDGSQITAEDVVKSLNRSRKDRGETLKSLFSTVESIAAKDIRRVVFKLKDHSSQNTLIRKLTEPMYGVFWIKDGKLNFDKSSGPFRLKSSTENEISLEVNKHWISYQAQMADAIIVRKPPKGNEVQENLLKDSWANLFTASSLMPESLHGKFIRSDFKLWNRNIDRVFFLSPSQKLHSNQGRVFFRFLNENLSRTKLVNNLSGYTETNQFFPQGYALFNPEFSFKKKGIKIPTEFKTRPLVILGAESRLDEGLRDNISDAIKSVTGILPKFKIVSLSDFEKSRARDDYDLLAGSLPVNDPYIEGALDFYFGLTPPIIPDGGSEQLNFKKQIEEAKKINDQSVRTFIYRKVFSDAIQEGCVLPLFHFATVVIAKKGLDLSRVPTTDETVSFSKVRFE